MFLLRDLSSSRRLCPLCHGGHKPPRPSRKKGKRSFKGNSEAETVRRPLGIFVVDPSGSLRFPELEFVVDGSSRAITYCTLVGMPKMPHWPSVETSEHVHSDAIHPVRSEGGHSGLNIADTLS